MMREKNYREVFEAWYSDMLKIANYVFRGYPDREDRMAEAVAIAWGHWLTVIAQGKQEEEGTLRACLSFGVQKAKAGRTSTGNGVDFLSKGTRAAEVESMETRRNNPASVVAFNLDLEQIKWRLTGKERRVIEMLGEGYTMGEIAEKEKVDTRSVWARVEKIRKKLRESKFIAP